MKYVILAASLFLSLNTYAKSGVLIVAHGSMENEHGHKMQGMCHTANPSQWEKSVLDAVAQVKNQLNMETEVAFGMWDTDCFNAGIDRLNSKLAGELDHLYVLPLFISSYSAVIEMQKFMFGIRADRAIPIPTVQKVNFAKKITYLPAIDYNPQISFILSNRVHSLIHDAGELGFNRNQMEVVLLMHGPVSDEDNLKWIEMGNSYVKDVSYIFPTSKYHIVSLRDDASAPVRDEATKELRQIVSNATSNGKVTLILPLLLSSGGIDQGITQRLEGLTYVWRNEMLLPDLKLEDYIVGRINNL